jgi:AraC family transcriptional regulator
MEGPAKTPIEDALDRGRLYIRQAYDRPLTLPEIAGAAGVSPFHFSRQFTARFGSSPMSYLRALRLAHAAHRVNARPRPNLAQLAFDCGFESQEGFTRAFASVYGAPPGRFRRSQIQIKEPDLMSNPPVRSVRLTGGDAPVLCPPVRIAGISRDFSESNRHEIPALWARLFSTPGVAEQALGRTFGVCCAIEASEGDLNYMAGIELTNGADLPEELTLIELPARPYLVFRMAVDGSDLHPQMQAAAREIWGVRVPACGFVLDRAPDLEVYPPQFDPTRSGAILEWWLPVKG